VLARLGIVRLALKLALSGSRTIPKFLAKASAGRSARMTDRMAGEVRKMPRELWPAVAEHWGEARCFRALANALESLPVSVDQLDENRPLGDLPTIVLSAATATPQVMEEHARDARLSTRGEHLVVPGASHWMQLDTPDIVVEAIRRAVNAAGGF